MRTLLLMRGAPGSGKSTWIKENNLEQYTLSPDNLRVLCSSTSLTPEGEFKITQDQNNEAQVWKVLFELLEYRMSLGEFTVVDATCSKTRDINQYKELADQYRYRVFIVDFTDIPLDICLKQNKMRPEFKQVPEAAIRNIYARFATQQIPAAVKIIKRDELDTLLEKPIDLSNYEKLIFIGDIHGCYDTLMQYEDFKNGLNLNYEYIFTGDYCDRGNQNFEVLEWLDKIKDLPNVCLLEGNHERHLFNFGNGAPAKSKEFENVTKIQLLKNNYDPKKARMLYRKLRQFSHITYNGLELLACHGGIPNLSTNSLFLPTKNFIKGVGNYEDYQTIAESWMGQTKENCYLIHGHRNTQGDETRIADRVFNLEGKVEFGGALRIVELDKDLNWNVVELKSIQPVTEENVEKQLVTTVEDAIVCLQHNKYVQEKKLGGGISSFNFTRDAFYESNWNTQTILARGLFIDMINKKIMARSYEKFFRINETHETEMRTLKDRLQFPVEAYVKENGFLAIVSYDYNKDDLFIASKSTNKGEFVDYIESNIEPYKDKILELYGKGVLLGTSLVFECIDIEHDPHIIKYNQNKLVLLDVIYNQLDFETFPYEGLKEIAENIGCPYKEKAFEIKTWDEFRDLYLEMQKEDYKYNDQFIEGFVFKDQSGFMTKCKSGYYNLWKKMRGVADQTLRRGYITKTGMLTSETENYFYGFCKELYKNDFNKETKEYPYKTDIISLREKFEIK